MTTFAVGLGSDGTHGKRKGAKYVAGHEILKNVGGKVDGVIIYTI